MSLLNRKRIWYLFLIIILTLLAHGFLINRQWTNQQYMVGPNDQLVQMQIFKDLLYQQFKAGNYFYSFDFAGGASFFTRLSYYYSTSMFNCLIMIITWLLETLGLIGEITMVYWAEIALFSSIIKSILIYIATLYYLKQVRIRPFYAIIGGFFYVFSSIYFRHAILWEFFTDAMIFLPLILAGMEKIITQKSGWLFTIAVGLSLFNNAYFAYINLLFAIVYALLRMLFPLWHQEASKIEQFKNYLIYGGLGIGVSAPGFLTFANGFFNSVRLSSNQPIAWLNIDFLRIETMLLNDTVQMLPMIFVMILFIRNLYHYKSFRFFTTFSLVMIILRASPMVASLFNGFSYPQYRFPYVTFLLIAVVIGMGLQLIRQNNNSKRIKQQVLFSAGLTLLLYAWAIYRDQGDFYTKWSILGLVIGFTVFIICTQWGGQFKSAYYLLFMFLVTYPIYTNQKILIENYNIDRVNQESVYNKFENPDQHLIQAFEFVKQVQKPLQRLDYDETVNFAMQQTMGYLGSYISFQNQYQQSLYHQLGVINQKESNSPTLRGLAGRTALNALMQVDYIIIEEGTSYLVPNHYQIRNQFGKYIVYENLFPYAPIHPVKDLYSETDFSQYDLKDSYMINGAIVPDQWSNAELNPELKNDLSFKLLGKDHLTNPKLMTETGSHFSLELLIEPTENIDTIVIDYTIKRHNNDKNDQFHYSFDGKVFEIKASTDEYSSHTYRHQMHLPYKETIKIQLASGTGYDFEIHHIYGLNDTNHKERSLADKQLDYDYQVSDGNVDIRFNNQDQYPFMVLPIFYEDGWQLTINQQPVDIIKSNYGLIGFPLKNGENQIQLKFEQPLVKIGSILSALSLTGLLIVVKQKKL